MVDANAKELPTTMPSIYVQENRAGQIEVEMARGLGRRTILPLQAMMDYQIAKYYVGYAIKRHRVPVDNSTECTTTLFREREYHLLALSPRFQGQVARFQAKIALIETIRWKRKPDIAG
jgi:hypothetical protein